MKRLLKTILVLFLIIVLSGSAFLIFQGYRNYQTLSEAHPISELIRDEQGKQEYVKLEEISPYLVDATISVEDKNFYEHGGVDLAGVARAVLSNLFGIGEPSGGSTISQQLCKNLYGLFYDTSLTRKITEAFLTYDLEKNFKKINAYSRNKQHKNKSQAPVTDSRDFDNNSFNNKYSVYKEKIT